MTLFQVEYLKDTINRPSSENKKDVIWHQAFKEYNDMTKSNLRMGCSPCYGKVLQYLSGLKNGSK